jgi:hypothetical protein
MAKDVKIRITAKDLTKRAVDTARRGIRSLGKTAVNAGKAIGRAFGSAVRGVRNLAIASGVALTAFGVSAVKAAADAEAIRGKFDAVFKDASKDVRAWADTFSKSVNRASIDMEAMLAKVQDLFVPLGFGRREAAAFSKEVTKLAVDIASFNDKADDDVLRDLQSALVGNSETVRKYGIILTEAAIAEEAVALGAAKTTKKVSNQAKVLARLSLIRKGSTDAEGDAIRTSGELNNVLKRLGGAYKTLRIEIGTQLIQGLGLAKNFTELAKKVTSFTTSLKETGAIKTFAKEAMARLKPVVDLVKDLFEGGEKREIAIGKIKEFGTEFGADVVMMLEKAAPRIGALIAKGIVLAPIYLGKGAGAIGAEVTSRQGVEAQQRAVNITGGVETFVKKGGLLGGVNTLPALLLAIKGEMERNTTATKNLTTPDGG